MSSRGVLDDDDGETVTLTFRRVYPHTREHVWDAIATPEGLRGWLMCTHAEIDSLRNRIELVSGPGQYRSTGAILRWEPPALLEYEWNIEPVPAMPHGEHAVFRFELAAQDPSTTLLVVTYRRITRATATGFLPGVHVMLDRLEAQLAGRELPNWYARFLEVSAAYPEWKGHATPAGE